MATYRREDLMKQAIKLAQENMAANKGGPFGAIIVKDGKVIAEGGNEVTSKNDPSAHAEIVAIRNACKALGSFDLSGCDIYTSCEPCPMCLCAIYWARLNRVFFAATRNDAAAVGFDDKFFYDEIKKDISERTICMDTCCREDALKLFKAWDLKEDKILY